MLYNIFLAYRCFFQEYFQAFGKQKSPILRESRILFLSNQKPVLFTFCWCGFRQCAESVFELFPPPRGRLVVLLCIIRTAKGGFGLIASKNLTFINIRRVAISEKSATFAIWHRPDRQTVAPTIYATPLKYYDAEAWFCILPIPYGVSAAMLHALRPSNVYIV